MESKLTVAVFAETGVGGTEKAAVFFATALAQRGHRVIYLAKPGPREADLIRNNVRRIDLPGCGREMMDILRREQVDLIHQHAPGYPIQLHIYPALKLMGERRPRLIETNVFGRLEDPDGNRWIDFRLFISRASAVQAFQRSGLRMDEEALRRSTVLTYPLAPLPVKEEGLRTKIRQELGIEKDEVLVLRIGRPGPKWNRSELQVFQKARRWNPLLRLLLMEPTEDIWREVESGQWGEGIILHRVLTDFSRLAAIYASGDMMLHMSDWGESFGYTIAEAMQESLPVIARTTPWGDNAQVELIEHGATGFICNSIEGATDCLVTLSQDSPLRNRLGVAAAKRIEHLSDLETEADLLEEVIQHVVSATPLHLVAKRNENLLKFQASFARRESKTWESERPGLKFYFLKGALYGAYRSMRARISRKLREIITRSKSKAAS